MAARESGLSEQAVAANEQRRTGSCCTACIP